MKIYLVVHNNLLGLQILTETLQHSILCSGEIFTYPTLASSGYISLYFGGGETGVSDFVTSLAYSNGGQSYFVC
jgi:hypothetical protein